MLIGNCTMDDVIERLFGNVSNFACLVEENGNNFSVENLTVKYDATTDIHTFYLED